MYLRKISPKHDVLVLRRVHVVAQRIRCRPQLGLEAEVGVSPFGLGFPFGHQVSFSAGVVGLDPKNIPPRAPESGCRPVSGPQTFPPAAVAASQRLDGRVPPAAPWEGVSHPLLFFFGRHCPTETP